MHRSGRATALSIACALGALALLGFGGCGQPQEQCAAACRSSVRVRVRVPYPYAGLAGKSLDVCRANCLHATFPPGDKNIFGTYDCAGTESARPCTVVESSVGSSEIDLEAAPETSYQNGDVYHIVLTDEATGTREIDATRTLNYELHTVCGETCPGAGLTVWPGADATASCSGRQCDSGAEIHAKLSAPPADRYWHVRACRNASCTEGLYQGMSPCEGSGGGILCSASCQTNELPLAGMTYECGHPVSVTISLPGLPEELADGDSYSVLVEAGGETLLDVSGSAKYKESMPNGAACDGVACKKAVLSF